MHYQSRNQQGDSDCTKKPPTGGHSTEVANVAMGVGCPQEERVEHALLSLSWEVDPEGKLVIPEGGSHHFH